MIALLRGNGHVMYPSRLYSCLKLRCRLLRSYRRYCCTLLLLYWSGWASSRIVLMCERAETCVMFTATVVATVF